MTGDDASTKVRVRLSDISDFITKGSTPTTYGHKWQTTGILFLRSECVSARGLDLGQSKFISDEANRSLRRSQVSDGDLLMTITGNVGRVVRLDGVGIANINQHIARIRVRDNGFDPDYVFHFLSQNRVRETSDAITTGQAYPQLSLAQVRDTFVEAPPIGPQRAIARTLNSVDAMVASLGRLIAKKQAIRLGMMQQLLTGRTRLPGFTAEWLSGPLGKFMPLQRGFDLPSSQLLPGKYPVVYSNGISQTHAKAMVQGPGVVTGRSGTIGKVHYVESDYWPHNTALWITSFAHTDARFVYYFLTYLGLERFASGSGVPTFNRNDAHGFEILLPSQPEEQTAIADALGAIDDEISALNMRKGKAIAVKQGMMQELLASPDDAKACEDHRND